MLKEEETNIVFAEKITLVNSEELTLQNVAYRNKSVQPLTLFSTLILQPKHLHLNMIRVFPHHYLDVGLICEAEQIAIT